METGKKRRNIIANFAFFIVVIIILGIVLFNLDDINEIIEHTKNANIMFLLVSLVLIIIHMLLTSLNLHIIQKKVENNLPFYLSMNIANTEHLFNAITPFSSGGQPIQAYYLVKSGMTGEESASVLVANFIIYQFVITVFSTIGLIIYFPFILNSISGYAFVITIGFIINALILIFLILISRVDSFKKLIKGIFTLLAKIKFLNKIMVNLENKTFTFVENFQQGTKYLLSNKRVLFSTIALRTLDLFVFFSIPIFIFLALNVNVEFNDILFIIMMTAFSATFMMWVPTPGATGGVEWAFNILFVGVIANSSVVVSALLYWRLLTYLFPMLLGFVSFLIVRKRGALK